MKEDVPYIIAYTSTLIHSRCSFMHLLQLRYDRTSLDCSSGLRPVLFCYSIENRICPAAFGRSTREDGRWDGGSADMFLPLRHYKRKPFLFPARRKRRRRYLPVLVGTTTKSKSKERIRRQWYFFLIQMIIRSYFGDEWIHTEEMESTLIQDTSRLQFDTFDFSFRHNGTLRRDK